MYFVFFSPYMLFILVIVPLVYYLYVKFFKDKKESTLHFSNLEYVKKAMPKRSFRRHLEFVLLVIVMSLFVLGFADPHVLLKTSKKGINVALVIDTSGSMSATDYKPSRLKAAKEAAADLINDLKPNDMVGLVTFNTEAYTVSYLTPNKQSVLSSLESLKAGGGTAIGNGLSLGVNMVSSIPNKKMLVILLTDGVNNAGSVSPIDAAEFAKSKNVVVDTIAIGSSKPKIIGYDMFGNPEYAKVDTSVLKKIAKVTGGVFYAAPNSLSLRNIYQNIAEHIKRVPVDTSIANWFYYAGFLVLLFYAYLKYGRFRILE